MLKKVWNEETFLLKISGWYSKIKKITPPSPLIESDTELARQTATSFFDPGGLRPPGAEKLILGPSGSRWVPLKDDYDIFYVACTLMIVCMYLFFS